MATQTSQAQQLIVTLAGKQYALPVCDVCGVLTLSRADISPVPYDVLNKLFGVFYYKGSVIGLLNVNGFTAAAYTKDSEKLTAVLLGETENRFAVLVDGVNAITDAPRGKVTPITAQALYQAK